MRFGETIKETRKKQEKYNTFPFKKCFAWLPVVIETRETVWLESYYKQMYKKNDYSTWKESSIGFLSKEYVEKYHQGEYPS